MPAAAPWAKPPRFRSGSIWRDAGGSASIEDIAPYWGKALTPWSSVLFLNLGAALGGRDPNVARAYRAACNSGCCSSGQSQ